MSSIEEICRSSSKREDEATGILSLLFRRLLKRGFGEKPPPEITENEMDAMMRQYLADPKNGVGGDNKRRSSIRGNLAKEVARDNMTWYVFLKGIRWLRPARATITIKLDYPGGSRVASTSVLLQDIVPEEAAKDTNDDEGS